MRYINMMCTICRRQLQETNCRRQTAGDKLQRQTAGDKLQETKLLYISVIAIYTIATNFFLYFSAPRLLE